MPSVCAGLRQTLLHGYGRGFPLDPSPFQRLADATGATPRELLQQCRQLHDQALLEGLGVVWGEPLKRQRWRIGFAGAAAPAAWPLAEACPGLIALEHWHDVPASVGAPLRWCWIEAHDAAQAEAQLQQLRELFGQREVHGLKQRTAPDPCDCGDQAPCADRELAEALEDGLPLCAHPYAALAERLGRTERELRNRLRRWQELGWLAGIGLLPRFALDHQPMQGLLLTEAPPDGLSWPAGVELLRWPVTPTWPYAAELRWHGPAERSDVRRFLASAGLTAGSGQAWGGLLQPLRRQARLFSPEGPHEG